MSAIREADHDERVEMDLESARDLVARLVVQIAPNLDVDSIDEASSLHDVGDIDSLDFLHLVALTADATGILVPPRDYPRLVTLEGFATYLMERQVTQ